jgi:AcrR family transcriptional regulator
MARRTKEDADRTRELVLDAAEQVFLERGVARATLDDVAQAAGFTRGAVHWHFKDKIGLFNALVGRVLQIEEALVQRISAIHGPDPLKSLRDITIETLRNLETDPRQRRLVQVLRLRCEYTEELAPALDRHLAVDALLLKAVQRIFASVASRGGLAPGWKPKVAGLAFHALAWGLVDTWLRTNGKDFSLARDGAAAIRAFVGGVAYAPAGLKPALAAGNQERV